MFIDLFRRFGCNYLNLNGLPENYSLPPEQPLFWPANFGVGVNPCVENGFYYPVKPISYFCPVACGCRAGDAHCPDRCEARTTASNYLGQVAANGLNSNPSPLNVDKYPWRYSSQSRPSNCTTDTLTWPHCPLEDHNRAD